MPRTSYAEPWSWDLAVQTFGEDEIASGVEAWEFFIEVLKRRNDEYSTEWDVFSAVVLGFLKKRAEAAKPDRVSGSPEVNTGGGSVRTPRQRGKP